MQVKSNKLENGDLEITLTFDTHDQICLEHDLPDIVSWYVSGPASEKIHSCRKRMINDNREALLKSDEMASKTMREVNEIMADPKLLCEAIKKMPSYKNRKERETINVD